MDTHNCPECGEAMPENANNGMCPACLMRTRPGDGMPWISDVTLGFSDDAPAPKGEMTGRYHVLKEHARGGMGRILLAHDPDLGRDVALKQLLPMSDMGIGAGWTPTDKTHPVVARFLREARITGQLEHPSITPVHELGQNEDGSFYYTMKFVKGRTLAEVIKECKNLKERLRLLPHFVDLCNAIAYAHSKGVIHRDIKPQNVLIGEFGETVVVDWGLAKIRDREDVFAKELQETLDSFKAASQHEADKTVAGTALGTPTYMPPEQVRGELFRIDERSDIYSLGVVLYQILTGTLPFHGRNISELFAKVLDDAPPSPLSLDRKIPEDLAKACLKAMSKKPADRFATAKELGQLVEVSKLRPPKSRVRKFAERGALALLVGIPLFIIVANWYTGYRLEQIKARMENEGISTSGKMFKTRNWKKSEQDILPQNIDPTGAIYALEMQFPNLSAHAYDLFKRPFAKFKLRGPDSASLSGEEIGEMRKILDECSEMLSEAHRIAEMPRTSMSPELQYLLSRAKHTWEVHLPGLLHMWNCAQLLAYESIIKYHDGDMGGALQSCIDSLRFSAHSHELPTLIGASIRVKITNIALDATQTLLHDGQYSVAQLAPLKQLLDELIVHEPIGRCFQDEINTGVDAFQTIQTDPSIAAYDLGGGRVGYIFAFLYGSFPLRFWLNLDQTNYFEGMEQALLISRCPFYEVKKKWEKLNDEAREGYMLFYPLSKRFRPGLYAINVQLMTLKSKLEMARISIAFNEVHE